MRAYLVTPGFEAALQAELGGDARVVVPGVVVADGEPATVDPVFARQLLPDVREVAGESVRALAVAAYQAVEGAIDAAGGPFTIHMITPADIHWEAAEHTEAGLGSRVALVGEALLELLAQRRRRAWRRYQPAQAATAGFDQRWMLVQLLGIARGRLLASAAAPRPLARGGTDLARWPAGAAPVAVDRTPPSRAYQKLEEAFQWIGAAPEPGQTCADLGASPGSWTMMALRRGARVIAVDRAPLQPPAAGLAGLTSVIGNAFTYAPPSPVDWLLCDVVCEPARSIALVDTWLSEGRCRNLVVTVKFKGKAGYSVLSGLAPIFDRVAPAFARVKQLGHNKNEVTVMVRRA